MLRKPRKWHIGMANKNSVYKLPDEWQCPPYYRTAHRMSLLYRMYT